MNDYVAPDPKVASYVYEQKEELRSLRERLEQLPNEELELTLKSKTEPKLRLVALSIRVQRIVKTAGSKRNQMEGPLTELYGELLDDSQPDVARMAIHGCPLTTDACIQKVRHMLNSSDDQVRAEAALALAKIKDETVFSTLVSWLHGDDNSNRNIAIESLKTLGTDAAKQELKASYESGGRDDEERAVLAVALLRLGDTAGLEYLETIAERAIGPFSVMAATWIWSIHEADEGLRMMLHILDKGDLEAKRSLVSQICHSWLRSPHAFTADGIHEARFWIERKLASPDKRPIP